MLALGEHGGLMLSRLRPHVRVSDSYAKEQGFYSKSKKDRKITFELILESRLETGLLLTRPL